MKPIVKEFFDENTWTLTFVVYDPTTKDAMIIDPVLDYDPVSSKISFDSNEKVIHFIQKNNLKTHFILETHAHADHISGSQDLKAKLPGTKIGIGAKINEVQKVFKPVFNLNNGFKTDGSQFDLLLTEEKEIHAGSLTLKTIFTPGHTPACSTFIVGDAVFTGDALFMPDYGTGRCDFPAGSATQLYDSIHKKIYALPDDYRVFVGHDYLPNGRKLEFQSTIKEEKLKNIHLKFETQKDKFVHFREGRDKTLQAPKLLFQSVQCNIDAGHLPKEENGKFYFKIPVS